MPGIYVHVPFCKSKCAYCDFASYPKELSKCDLYFACLYKEIKGRSELLKDYVFDTVYFGGGTPSFVDPKYIEGAMRQIRNYYKIADGAEITIEMNPGTVTEEKVRRYEKIGFNRFSVGLQTSNDDLLRDIGRIHTKQEFIDAANLLKGKNFSADIMIGLENQTKDDIKQAIDLAASSGAKHISSESRRRNADVRQIFKRRSAERRRSRRSVRLRGAISRRKRLQKIRGFELLP